MNNIIALLNLVVAWCGTPTYSRLETFKVDECRVKLMECVQKTKDVTSCFVKTKMAE